MIFLLIFSTILNCALGYAVFNMLRKNEIMEIAIENFYTRLQRTLNIMRTLDEKQMFEKDDEVGDLFSQLTDTINELRPLLYGSVIDVETEEKTAG
jgi:hypothetical protein